MPNLSNDYLEGYTTAKAEDKEEINKAYSSLHTYEHEYAALKMDLDNKKTFIESNAKYIELGKALSTILEYVNGERK
jgi:hypothetical protein